MPIPELRQLSDYVFLNARRMPHREALVFGTYRETWTEAAERIERCAAAMLVHGLRRGDRVAMLTTPRPDYFIVLMAALRIGAIWIGLNPRHRASELRHVIFDAEPSIVFSINRFEGRDFIAELSAPGVKPATTPLVAMVENDRRADLSFAAFLGAADGSALARTVAAAAATDPSDPAVIVYTSGTTGLPKGAVLTHRGLVRSYSVQASRWQVDGLRIINNMPVNHIGGLGDITAYTVIAGGTLIFMERFDPPRLLHLIETEQVSVLGQVTAMYQKLVNDPDWSRANLSSLKFLWWAGSEAPIELVELLTARCPRTATYYGMTELSGSVTYVDSEAPAEVKASTIGRPVSEFAVRIADEQDRAVPAGHVGEIQVIGDNVFAGYWRRSEETRQAFTSDGWFKTGDLGQVGPDGNWRIVSRLKEMYKSGGYNIYPRELERVLEAHPAIAAAAIVSVPDCEWQEIGCAFIQMSGVEMASTTDIELYMRANLANYKVPKLFRVVEEWPMTTSGKIDKLALRALALENYRELTG